MSKELQKSTPLPFRQIVSVIMVQLCESLNVNVLFPFLAFMVEDFGYTGDRLGYYAGFLAASFCAAQFCSSLLWGMFSDKFGRKPAAVIGVLGAAAGMATFGFSKSYKQAVIGRMIGGFLSGNLVVLKSFLTEITDDTNRGTGFSYMSVAWAIGTVTAPLIGGLLSKPAENYPNIFPAKGLFGEYPYLLPCLLCVVTNVISAIICTFTMADTKVLESPCSGCNCSYFDWLSPSNYRSVLSYDDAATDLESSNSGTSIDISERGGEKSYPLSFPETDDDVDTNNDINTDTDSASIASEVRSRTINARNPKGMKTLINEDEDDDDETEIIFNNNSNYNDKVQTKSSKSNSIRFFCCFHILYNALFTKQTNLNQTHEPLTTSTSTSIATSTTSILLQKDVILSTANYGLLCMAYILYDETIPLFLKQSTDYGGFGFTSAKIGFVLSISGSVWLLFTAFALPIISKRSKFWMYNFGMYVAIPLAILWPILGKYRSTFLYYLPASYQNTSQLLLLILLCINKFFMSCLSFTASMLFINHSVEDKYLGLVNGLGQCFASLARSVGPAVGGILWSLSIRTRFIFMNFIVVILLFISCIIINSKLSKSLETKKITTTSSSSSFESNAVEGDYKKHIEMCPIITDTFHDDFNCCTSSINADLHLEFSEECNDNEIEHFSPRYISLTNFHGSAASSP